MSTIYNDIDKALIYVFALILGAILGYYMNKSHKTLSRIPFLVLFSVNLYVFSMLDFSTSLFLIITKAPATFFIAAVGAIPAFIWMFVSMYLSVYRARDAFGQKSAACLLLIPIVQLMLVFFRVGNNYQGEIVREPIETPKYMNGFIGFILTIIFLTFSFIVFFFPILL